MKILALDLATKTGWACNEPLISGTENFRNKTGDSRGMIYIRFNSWLTEMLITVQPDLVVYERPHARGRAANEVLNGLVAYMTTCCTLAGCDYTDCASTTLKKFATGKGNASKGEMIEACAKEFTVCPVDDNHADALWLLAWAENEFGGGKR